MVITVGTLAYLFIYYKAFFRSMEMRYYRLVKINLLASCSFSTNDWI